MTKTKPHKSGTSSDPAPERKRTKPPDTQFTVNELVWKHGKNLREWSNVAQILTEAGLVDLSRVTDLVWDRAEKELTKRLERSKDATTLTWVLLPQEEEWATGWITRWKSDCGRYRITRFARPDDKPSEFGSEYLSRNGKSWVVCESDSKMGSGYAKYYTSLRGAVESVQRFHCKSFDLSEVEGNSEQLILSETPAEFPEKVTETATPSLEVPYNDPDPEEVVEQRSDAPDDNTDESEDDVTTATATKETVTLKESKVRAMLLVIGVNTEEMSRKKVQSLVNNGEKFTELVGEATEEIKDGSDEMRTFKSVSEALSEGHGIIIEAESAPEAETNGHTDDPAPAKKGRGRPKKTEPVTEEPKAPKTKGKGKPTAETKTKLEGKKKTKEKPAAKRPKVMDKYSAGSFVRWLGRQGVVFEDAKNILKGYGIIHLSDGSIAWELKEVREGHGPAEVSPEDFKTVKKAHPDAFKAKKKPKAEKSEA